MTRIPVRRSETRLDPDPTRLIARTFLPGSAPPMDGRTRVAHVLDRVLAMSRQDADATLADVRETFASRHEELDDILLRGFARVAPSIPDAGRLDESTRRLIGAYFIHEYSVEAAALTNPSVVAAQDQTGVPRGALRFVLSLRAIGEGHISSIEFRTGILTADGRVTIEPARSPVLARRSPAVYEKRLFVAKLDEMGALSALVGRVFDRLGDEFALADLEAVLESPELHRDTADEHAVHTIHWLADSNYRLDFPPASDLSQRLIFPVGPAEIRGMEDVRLTPFREDDGSLVHYATYTAYDGYAILPQLIETADFATFRVATLNGPAAQNKGLALFPRRIDGRYAALARSDNENNYLLFSDHVRFWHESERIQVPTRPWELVQVGNCGAPLETEAGWLVITHGVGPMRTYALGAILLDRHDPARVIGHLREPLLAVRREEREGYVPNVVYSCGALIHDDVILLPYGISDTSTGFALVPLDALLEELTRGRAEGRR